MKSITITDAFVIETEEVREALDDGWLARWLDGFVFLTIK